jgi:16S rRNA processing protein RimM
MILKENIFPIGQINKPHGINGEMSFTFTTDIFEREEIPFFILETEGIFVPFFIEEYRFKSDASGLIKFEDVDTEMKARAFTGLTIYLPLKYIEKVEDEEIGLEYFTGFKLFDNKDKEIGVITDIDQTTENALFIIDNGIDELLIPVSEEYITSIDHDQKIIHVSLPEGLLELF